MDHSEAVQTRAAERYLLDELTDAERSAFEEHYFECQLCADDIASGAVLLENLQEVLQAEPQALKVVSLRRRPVHMPTVLAASLIFALAGLASFQNFVTIPNLQQKIAGAAAPQSLVSVSLMASASRSQGVPVVQAVQHRPFSLLLDIPSQQGYSSYLCEFRKDGKLEFSIPVSASQVNETVSLLIPAGSLEPGSHEIEVRGSTPNGSTGPEIVHYSFQLETK